MVLFQQDRSSVHQYAEGWIEDHGLKRLTYPTYSPDLSPIETFGPL